jgi:hypothetical protein
VGRAGFEMPLPAPARSFSLGGRVTPLWLNATGERTGSFAQKGGKIIARRHEGPGSIRSGLSISTWIGNDVRLGKRSAYLMRRRQLLEDTEAALRTERHPSALGRGVSDVVAAGNTGPALLRRIHHIVAHNSSGRTLVLIWPAC